MTEKDKDFIGMTFSQREGKAPLPEVMTLESIPRISRQMFWAVFDLAIKKLTHSIRTTDFGRARRKFHSRYGIPRILYSFLFNVNSIPHDEIPLDPDENKNFVRKLILEGEYHEVITFVEYVLRHELCSDDLHDSLMNVFDKTPIAYFVKKINNIPVVVPRASREVVESAERAIETVREGGMDGAAAHLRAAAEHLNARQYADSIADSIHAVESVARAIDPESSKTLGPALKSLERAGALKHPSLRGAFEKLYGYASDEQGVRHALIDKGAADVGLDEAMFMFGACASFAAYLTGKRRQAEGA